MDGFVLLSGAEHLNANLDLSGEYPVVHSPGCINFSNHFICQLCFTSCFSNSDLPYLGGLLDLTPDVLPVLACIPSADGLYIAAGFSGHGFGIAPAVGEVLAKKLRGEETLMSLEAFSFDRFDSRLGSFQYSTSAIHG